MSRMTKKSESKKQKSSSTPAYVHAKTIIIPPPTQFGISERLGELYSGFVYFCQDSGYWRVWNGLKFVISLVLLHRFAKAAIRSFKKGVTPNSNIITTDGDQVTYDDLITFIKKNSTASAMKGMLFCAQSIMGIAAVESDFDSQPHLFGCKNGIFDLFKGELIMPDPLYKLSKIGGTICDPKADCPRWYQFLSGITKGRKSLINYLQVVAGYCLTGETTEQVMFLFYGTGANGKSTFLDILLKVAGDYGMTTPSRDKIQIL